VLSQRSPYIFLLHPASSWSHSGCSVRKISWASTQFFHFSVFLLPSSEHRSHSGWSESFPSRALKIFSFIQRAVGLTADGHEKISWANTHFPLLSGFLFPSSEHWSHIGRSEKVPGRALMFSLSFQRIFGLTVDAARKPPGQVYNNHTLFAVNKGHQSRQ